MLMQRLSAGFASASTKCRVSSIMSACQTARLALVSCVRRPVSGLRRRHQRRLWPVSSRRVSYRPQPQPSARRVRRQTRLRRGDPEPAPCDCCLVRLRRRTGTRHSAQSSELRSKLCPVLEPVWPRPAHRRRGGMGCARPGRSAPLGPVGGAPGEDARGLTPRLCSDILADSDCETRLSGRSCADPESEVGMQESSRVARVGRGAPSRERGKEEQDGEFPDQGHRDY